MGKKNKSKVKQQQVQFYSGLSDFGTPERRLHDLVVVGEHADSWRKTVKQARVLAPIELYARRGLLGFSKDDKDENELHLKAGERFARLYLMQKAAIGSPRVRVGLADFVGGSSAPSVYDAERDAQIVKDFRDLRAYVGKGLFPYLEEVAGEGHYAEAACSKHHCNKNQYMHSLRMALRECVNFWGM